jgi:hypothetical protein
MDNLVDEKLDFFKSGTFERRTGRKEQWSQMRKMIRLILFMVAPQVIFNHRHFTHPGCCTRTIRSSKVTCSSENRLLLQKSQIIFSKLPLLKMSSFSSITVTNGQWQWQSHLSIVTPFVNWIFGRFRLKLNRI